MLVAAPLSPSEGTSAERSVDTRRKTCSHAICEHGGIQDAPLAGIRNNAQARYKEADKAHTQPKLCEHLLSHAELLSKLALSAAKGLTQRAGTATQVGYEKHCLRLTEPLVHSKKMLLIEAREDLGS